MGSSTESETAQHTPDREPITGHQSTGPLCRPATLTTRRERMDMTAKNLQELLDQTGDTVGLLRNSQLGTYIYPVVPSEFTNWGVSRRHGSRPPCSSTRR